MGFTFEQYRQAWDQSVTHDPLVPLNLDIELASLCNLRCPFCFWGDIEFARQMIELKEGEKPRARFMPTEMALNLIFDAFKIGIPALKFNWRGESTLHPDYSLILQDARRRRDSCGDGKVFHELLVNTNGNVSDKAMDGLMAATKVMVSLDSMIPETYAQMRVGGNFRQAISTIHALVGRLHPNIWVRRVITSQNADEPFAAQVRALFGEYVHVSEHFEFPRGEEKQRVTSYRTYCAYPSQRLLVSSEGHFFPCCVDYDGTMPLGTYPTDTISEVWASSRLRSIRSELRSNILTSHACKNCTSYMAYAVPERNHVQDREVK